jgi:hypothetical protein
LKLIVAVRISIFFFKIIICVLFSCLFLIIYLFC